MDNLISRELDYYTDVGCWLNICEDGVTEMKFKEKLLGYSRTADLTMGRILETFRKCIEGLNDN